MKPSPPVKPIAEVKSSAGNLKIVLVDGPPASTRACLVDSVMDAIMDTAGQNALDCFSVKPMNGAILPRTEERGTGPHAPNTPTAFGIALVIVAGVVVCKRKGQTELLHNVQLVGRFQSSDYSTVVNPPYVTQLYGSLNMQIKSHTKKKMADFEFS